MDKTVEYAGIYSYVNANARDGGVGSGDCAEDVFAMGQRSVRRLGSHCVGGSFQVRCCFLVRLWGRARAAWYLFSSSRPPLFAKCSGGDFHVRA